MKGVGVIAYRDRGNCHNFFVHVFLFGRRSYSAQSAETKNGTEWNIKAKGFVRFLRKLERAAGAGFHKRAGSLLWSGRRTQRSRRQKTPRVRRACTATTTEALGNVSTLRRWGQGKALGSSMDREPAETRFHDAPSILPQQNGVALQNNERAPHGGLCFCHRTPPVFYPKFSTRRASEGGPPARGKLFFLSSQRRFLFHDQGR